MFGTEVGKLYVGDIVSCEPNNSRFVCETFLVFRNLKFQVFNVITAII